MLKIAETGIWRGYYTYGYRRIMSALEEQGIHYAEATIRRLMRELDIQPKIFNQHRNQGYSSYEGNVGKTAKNLLKQKFTATEPYTVLHTDVTQIKLGNNKWGYLSVITDQATKELLAAAISGSPNAALILDTLNQLNGKLPKGANPIIHSDQGWHYQLDYYRSKIGELGLIQSMSRKGNCLDNAPVESFFHLFKVESLYGFDAPANLSELKELFFGYADWYNNERISMKTKGMTPIAFRNHALAG